MKIKQKFVAIYACMIIIVTLGISLLSIVIFSRVYYRNVQSYIRDLTRQTKNNIENNIQDMEIITFDTLRNTIIQEQLVIADTKTLNEFERMLQSNIVEAELAKMALFNDNVISLSVVSLTGKRFALEKRVGEQSESVFSEQEIYDAKGSPIWTAGKEGSHDVFVGRGIFHLKSQKPIGYIELVCKEEYWGDIMQGISTSQGVTYKAVYTGGTYLVDTDQIVVSTNNKNLLGQVFPLDILKEGAIGSFYIAELQKERCLVFQDERMDNGWTLVTTVPFREVQRDMRLLVVICILMAGLIAAISILLVHRIVERMLKPLEDLCHDMGAVGEGDFTARVTVTSSDEIGKLGTAYNQMAENIKTLIDKVYKMEITQKQAEIEFLKMQINPHFLYNTLETISWMGRLYHQDDIADVTVALAELLRATIKQESIITIEEELKSVYNYVLIQKIRFGNKLNVKYDIEMGVRNDMIPNFILQPLIENSMIHGLEPKLTSGLLHIKIYEQGGRLHFLVCDDGVGMSEHEISRTYEECRREDSQKCIGIKNVYRRLHLSYGEQAEFAIESEKGAGTRVSFSIPRGKRKQS